MIGISVSYSNSVLIAIAFAIRAANRRWQLPDVGLRRIALVDLEAGGLDRFLQQRGVFAGQTVAAAERVEAVFAAGSRRPAPPARRPLRAGWKVASRRRDRRASQPQSYRPFKVTKRTPGCDVVLEPAGDCGGIKIVGVGVAYRDVDRADLAAFAPGDG